ncbi:MAG: YeeE/YedE family protein [Syntrophales bacterium]|jgi:uncharacterized membrane protein YedE/YeeE|nr:YeeE/YedE family protein [Syntrophales bacterium]MDY0045259.1 YeeE/YedE thiosulfate transporter family protein [Syntrophales bacterium]
MEALQKKSWSPYTVGAAIGALETAAMLTAKRPLGITSAFENAVALAAGKILPEKAVNEYARTHEETPKIDWETGLVAGVVFGSMLSARLSAEKNSSRMPEISAQKEEHSGALRYATAFGGGALMMLGARMANGCTSGHGISGTMQFAASSWLFVPVIFASGAIVSKAFFGRKK